MHNLGVVVLDELLDYRQRFLLQHLRLLGQNFGDFSEQIVAHVDISVVLENFSWQFAVLVIFSVDKVTKFTS